MPSKDYTSKGSKYLNEYKKRKSASGDNSEKPRRRFPETDEDETRVARKRGPMFMHRKKMLA